MFRRSLLLAGVALPTAAYGQCVTDTPAVDACRGGVRITAPPGVTLDLSFMVPGSMPPGVTFTRASTATYFDSTGTLQTATTNAPRWDYNPGTRALNGLLIEEARTSLMLQSSGFTTGFWGNNAVTLTAGAATAPDGTVTMTRVTETATTNFHYVSQSVAITASALYAMSVYAKASGIQYLQLSIDDGTAASGGYATFDLQAGVVSGPMTAIGAAAIVGAGIQPVGNGVYRCSIVGTAASAAVRLLYSGSNAPAPGFAPSYAGNIANSVLLWGSQFERGTFVTSYIPTAAVSVTRAQDSCAISSANMSPWFTLPGGSWMAEFITINANPGAASTRIIGVPTPSGIGPVLLMNGTEALGQYDGAVVNTANAVPPLVIAKGATTWSAGNATACLNGGAVAASAGLSTGYAALATAGVQIGANAAADSNGMNGAIRRVRYWPRVLSNAELQSVTT